MLSIRSILIAVFWVQYLLLQHATCTSAATQKKDNTGNGGNVVGMAIPTASPIVVSVVYDPAPVATSSPIAAPKDLGTTEDPQDGTTGSSSTNDMVQVCRSISRGVAVVTNTSIEIFYEFELLSTTATPSYTGIAVNNAVTNHLINLYIKPFCNQNRRLRQLRWHRSLQNVSSGDVQGISRGTTIVQEEFCSVPANDIGKAACHRLQSSNIVYFRDDYVANQDDLSILETTRDTILADISSAFSDGTITNDVVKGGETGLLSASYVSGTAGAVLVQGESRSINSTEGSKSGGMTPAGKAFLSLFILCLFFCGSFFLYKYGYCKVRKDRNVKNLNATATETTLDEGRSPFMVFCERFTRKVPSEVQRPYHFVVAERKLDQDDHHVFISDTVETSSNGGLGTEMILEDLQEHEERLVLSPPDRFTPSTLPRTKESEIEESKQRSWSIDEDGFPLSHDQSSFNDAFSFSDVNIIIDDSSSYASMGPNHVGASKRHYSVPDTVNL
jgi:hypothetical protein